MFMEKKILLVFFKDVNCKNIETPEIVAKLF